MLAPPPGLVWPAWYPEGVLDVRSEGSETGHGSEMVGNRLRPLVMWFPHVQKIRGWTRMISKCSFHCKLPFCYLLFCLPLCLLFLFQLAHLSTCLSHVHPHHFGPSHHHKTPRSSLLLVECPCFRSYPCSRCYPGRSQNDLYKCGCNCSLLYLNSSKLLYRHCLSHYPVYSLQSNQYCLK